MENLASTGSSLRSRFEQIREEYGKSITRADSDLNVVPEVVDQRDEALRVLTTDAQRLGPGEMNFDDIVAIATCHELLREFDEAITYSQIAVAMRPTDEARYFPLLRSLLNTGQLRRAESVVRTAERLLADTSAVGSLRLMLEAATSAASLAIDEGVVPCETSLSVR